jgi:hypothetical protein
LEPLLRSWLENDTPQEVHRLKQLLEGGRDAWRSSTAGSP